MTRLSWMFIHPYLPIRGSFLLPNRSNAFKLINTPLTSLECVSPVGSANHNQHYVLANAYFTYPVDYIDFLDIKVLKGLLSYLIQFLFRHSGIMLKVKLPY